MRKRCAETKYTRIRQSGTETNGFICRHIGRNPKRNTRLYLLSPAQQSRTKRMCCADRISLIDALPKKDTVVQGPADMQLAGRRIKNWRKNPFRAEPAGTSKRQSEKKDAALIAQLRTAYASKVAQTRRKTNENVSLPHFYSCPHTVISDNMRWDGRGDSCTLVTINRRDGKCGMAAGAIVLFNARQVERTWHNFLLDKLLHQIHMLRHRCRRKLRTNACLFP